MIELKQQVHNLLGSKNAIEELAKKQSARILVISDSHRESSVFSDIVKDYGAKCDALVFCGDGIGDLARVLNRASMYEEEMEFIPPVVAFVRGNGDPAAVVCDFDPTVDYPIFEDTFDDDPRSKSDDEKFLGQRIRQYYQLAVPNSQTLLAAGKKIFISHGHLQGVDYDDSRFISLAKMSGCKIIMHGHTHVSRDTEKDGIKIINPGSPARPRGGTPPGFAIVTIQGNVVDAAFIKITNKGYEFYTPYF